MSEDQERRFKIGEVCRLADLQPYVLRYWETEFASLAPNKSGGGQRMYSQREIDIILRIKQLLYSEGFTIAGAKKKLEGELNGNLELTSAAPADAVQGRPSVDRAVIRRLRKELGEILAILNH